MKRRIVLGLVFFLPIQIILVRVMAAYPQFVENVYSRGIFPLISKLERILFGWIPFSVGDIFYVVLIFVVLRWIYLRFKTKFKNPKKWILNGLATLSLVYFCFHFFWGMNYYRQPLHITLEIGNTYNNENLIDLTQRLIHKSNEYQEQLTETKDSAVVFNLSKKEFYRLSVSGYQDMAEEFPQLDYKFPSLKSSIFSLPLTYMGFSGYINPFTNEAQINYMVPAFRLAHITTHEMGHQLGFAKENEANFMACLATMHHSNPYFRYAGFTFAMQSCMNELRRRNPELAAELRKEINPGVIKNMEEAADFWRKYQNPVEPVFKIFYGNYLKVNNQPQGMGSYNYVVALLVNYYGKQNEL